MTIGARDRTLIYSTAFVRAVATGLVGVEIGLYLAARGLPAAQIGSIVSAGLAGAACAALIATLAADRHGRRRMLVECALLGAGGSCLLAVGSTPLLIGLAAFVGMINGMGRDRGASLIIEQAILPATTTDAQRTMVLARYNVIQDIGHAVGALLAGIPQALEITGLSPVAGHQGAIVLYAALLIGAALLHRQLSPAVESDGVGGVTSVSSGGRRRIARISALFALDSLGGGFLTTALLAYFFFERFGAGTMAIALLFFAARILNAMSHLGAAWLARRIGLVNTMVFTHIPSSLLLVTVAFAPSFPIAALLFVLREGLVEMDVPTRQSYVLAIVRPEERTFASGATGIVRMGMWAVAPALGGILMDRAGLMTPLVIGAGIKILYDLMLWWSFRAIRPPEEA